MIGRQQRSGDLSTRFSCAFLAIVSAVFAGGIAAGPAARAGSVQHIRWGPDAPERLQAANVLLYEELVAFRDKDPIRFDKEHPFFFGILTDTAYINKIVARWEGHEQRFEYWHPYLWRILDGYVHRPVPVPPHDPGHHHGGGGGGGGQGSSAGGGGSGGGGGRGGGGGGGISSASVPEPGSVVLYVSGMVLAVAGAAARQRVNRAGQGH
jgi:uncharacterized membrane protein YgcG